MENMQDFIQELDVPRIDSNAADIAVLIEKEGSDNEQ